MSDDTSPAAKADVGRRTEDLQEAVQAQRQDRERILTMQVVGLRVEERMDVGQPPADQ